MVQLIENVLSLLPKKFGQFHDVDVWLLPILGAIIYHAGSEIEQHLDWAMKYLFKNALKLPQRKSNKDNMLEGIFERLKVQCMWNS